MKNFLCLFERPFKIQKNGVFLFEISFFVLEILRFPVLEIPPFPRFRDSPF